MNILFVDDEMDQLQGLRIGMRSRGYHVLETLTAEQAMEHLKNTKIKIDMVVIDYILPGMDGMEFVRAIRKKDKILPIIFMTGYGRENLDVDAFRSGCNGYIEKPFTLDELIIEIKRIKNAMIPKEDNSGGNSNEREEINACKNT